MPGCTGGGIYRLFGTGFPDKTDEGKGVPCTGFGAGKYPHPLPGQFPDTECGNRDIFSNGDKAAAVV